MALAFVEAHPAGSCGVAYIEHNREVQLITCGNDGKLCYRSSTNIGEITKSVNTWGDTESASPLTAIAAAPAGDRIAVADEQNFVKVLFSPMMSVIFNRLNKILMLRHAVPTGVYVPRR